MLTTILAVSPNEPTSDYAIRRILAWYGSRKREFAALDEFDSILCVLTTSDDDGLSVKDSRMTIMYLKTLLISAIVALLWVAVSLPVVAAAYKIDPAHSFIQFRTKHLGYSWLVGRFNRFEGTMNYDPSAGPEAQSISVTIDASSLDTNHAERDKHLRGEDFFNVKKHAIVRFVSTRYQGGKDGGTLTGDLTLLGVTKSISFEVRKIGEGDDPWGGYRAGFEGSYVLTRKDFGMGYNLGPTAEKVQLDLLIEAIRQ